MRGWLKTTALDLWYLGHHQRQSDQHPVSAAAWCRPLSAVVAAADKGRGNRKFALNRITLSRKGYGSLPIRVKLQTYYHLA